MVRAILVQMAAAGMLFSLVLFLTDRSHLVVGFVLGLAASMFNCILLGRQLKKTAELPMEKAIAQVQTGWFVRLFLAILLLALSALFAEINFLAALAGFFVFQIVLVLRAAFAFMRGWPKDRQERGE
jgi:hypothetical protein